MRRKLSSNPLIVLGAFIAVMAFLLWIGRWVDTIIVISLWALLLVMGVAALGRGVSGSGYGQVSVMPKWMRRWVFDERDPEKDQFQK